MALEGNQRALSLNTLYKVDSMGDFSIERDISASLWIDSGSVDLYGSDSATAPTSISEMTLNTLDTNLDGKISIVALPNYIAIVQNTGTTTEITLSGIEARSEGAIS